jgi:hypothetical protein
MAFTRGREELSDVFAEVMHLAQTGGEEPTRIGSISIC